MCSYEGVEDGEGKKKKKKTKDEKGY